MTSSFLASLLNCLAINPFLTIDNVETINPPTFRVHLLGLDASGKTTLMYRLKQNEIISTLPTYGYNVETIQHNNVNFTLWEVGGNDKVRSLWKYEFHKTHAIIYVVDAVFDQRRLFPAHDSKKRPSMQVHECVQDELYEMLREPNLKQCILLILLNKQDLPKAMDPNAFDDAFQIHRGISDPESPFYQRIVHIQPCSVITGAGLTEGFDWLSKELLRIHQEQPPR